MEEKIVEIKAENAGIAVAMTSISNADIDNYFS